MKVSQFSYLGQVVPYIFIDININLIKFYIRICLLFNQNTAFTDDVIWQCPNRTTNWLRQQRAWQQKPLIIYLKELEFCPMQQNEMNLL